MDNQMELGGVHLQYLYWCPRRLWLYAQGYRPEQYSGRVAMGSAIDTTTLTREQEIDLGAAKMDWIKS